MFRNVKGTVSTLYAIMFRKVKGPMIWLLLGMLSSFLFQTYRVYDPVLKLHFSNFVSLGNGFFNADAEQPPFFKRIDGSRQTITPIIWKNWWIRENDYVCAFAWWHLFFGRIDGSGKTIIRYDLIPSLQTNLSDVTFSLNFSGSGLCYLLSQYFNHDAMAMEKDLKKRSVEQLNGTCCHG